METLLKKKNYKILWFICLWSGLAIAQNSDFEKYKAQYPDASVVRLNNERNVKISLENGRLNILQNTREEDLYLNASAIHHAKKSLSYNTFFNLLEVKASTLNSEESGVVVTAVKDFVEKDELNDAFYDDQKSVNFILPNLKPGSISVIETKEQINNPRFLNPIYLGDAFPVANTRIVIEADKDITLQFKQFHTDGIDVKISQEEKRGKIIYTIESKNVSKFSFENRSPNSRKYVPHIIPVITQYKLKGKEVKLSGDVSNLYQWYFSLIKNINTQTPNPDLVKVVDSLLRDKTENIDKVRAIYYWAQEHIKYIAFEYALGGFVPRDANVVYEKKYGDCKDNSSIMSEMFQIANLPGSITWIGTRSIPYSYSELPSPISDNHMILTYTEGGKTFFLDATSRYHPLDLPTSFIQGKEALVAVDSLHYEIVEVPVANPERNLWIDRARFSIADNRLVGKGEGTATGYQKIEMYYQLESQTTSQKLSNYYRQLFKKGNNKFSLSNFKEIDKFAYDKDFHVTYDFTIEDYLSSYENEIFVNLNLTRYMQVFDIEKDRKTEMEFDYKNHNEFLYSFDVPEGYKVTFVPENFSLENDWLAVEISYRQEGQTIHYAHKITQNFLSLSVAQLQELARIKSKVEKAYKEVVVIEKMN
ncbi:MAG: DUF3857 domain-containing protein [Flavobacteriaceae bacterium]|nr:DUF3857 domain-containing protein [Flavobacteriaceae bacterium]